ncbi:MAG: ribonuclease HII [Pikeienuella sp.]
MTKNQRLATARVALSEQRIATMGARLGGPVAGIDEVGRGPWAGPVVAAAVVLHTLPPPGLDDSKRLSAGRREALAAELRSKAAIGIGAAEAAEIDRLGIVAATDLAMARAVAVLRTGGMNLVGALVDGKRVPMGLGIPAEPLVGADGLVASVAAASIVAKVHRDRLMVALDACHPGYGWARNKGYGTLAHRAALRELGPSAQHRMSFRPISEMEL